MLLVYASYSQGQIAEACYSFLRATSYLRSIIGEEYCEDSSSLKWFNLKTIFYSHC